MPDTRKWEKEFKKLEALMTMKHVSVPRDLLVGMERALSSHGDCNKSISADQAFQFARQLRALLTGSAGKGGE